MVIVHFDDSKYLLVNGNHDISLADRIIFQHSNMANEEFVNNQINLNKRKYIYKFVIYILLIKFRNILD